ncbi:MAG TPA: response regulator transcription factor [Candidatus Didemnitutus sp.]|nr:response regulator transcription factor [Candidatus Didemnitutus sp.]
MKFNGKVLVTDDEAHIRQFLVLILKRLGNPVVIEARNGQEAVAAYAAHRPDLVLLDVNMPVIDGVQALGQIRAGDPDALVVMLTSLTNRQTIEECSRLGATNYLRKDIPRDELIAQLQQVIDDNFEPEQPANPTDDRAA